MSAHVNGSSVQSGRPRDPRIDAEVLAATRDMLVEVGWDQLSLRAIATRAGVSRAALSRRWPSKAHLVLDSILGSTPDLAPFEGTDRAGWIDWVVAGSAQIFSRPDVRAAAPGLLAALRDHDDLRKRCGRGSVDRRPSSSRRTRGRVSRRRSGVGICSTPERCW